MFERYLPDRVDCRPNVLKLWKWTFEDLRTLGVQTNTMHGKGNKHVRTDTLQVWMKEMVSYILYIVFYTLYIYIYIYTYYSFNYVYIHIYIYIYIYTCTYIYT